MVRNLQRGLIRTTQRRSNCCAEVIGTKESGATECQIAYTSESRVRILIRIPISRQRVCYIPFRDIENMLFDVLLFSQKDFYDPRSYAPSIRSRRYEFRFFVRTCSQERLLEIQEVVRIRIWDRENHDYLFKVLRVS